MIDIFISIHILTYLIQVIFIIYKKCSIRLIEINQKEKKEGQQIKFLYCYYNWFLCPELESNQFTRSFNSMLCLLSYQGSLIIYWFSFVHTYNGSIMINKKKSILIFESIIYDHRIKICIYGDNRIRTCVSSLQKMCTDQTIRYPLLIMYF